MAVVPSIRSLIRRAECRSCDITPILRELNARTTRPRPTHCVSDRPRRRASGGRLCRALYQGAALHYLDGKNGVKDFDVWSFYAALGDGPFPYRWRGTADFGPSRFGRYPGDPPFYA